MSTAILNNRFLNGKIIYNMEPILTILTGLAGGIIALVGTYIKQKFKSSTKNEISLRDSTLKRITALEERQDELDKQLQKWIVRYWGLYKWIVQFCVEHHLKVFPPTFHDMNKAEIKEELEKIDGDDLDVETPEIDG